MRSGARWDARQFVPLDDGTRGLGGYNRDISQRACSAPSGHTFRAGDPHGARTCCSVISRVVPRSRIDAPVRKPSADELGNAPLGVTGAWAPLHLIRTEAWDRTGRSRHREKALMGLDALGLGGRKQPPQIQTSKI
ncbi:hypothetical protein Taro_031592 [Colocasia esculenta]|uniref:Uncharacterized protein n=1 Tax=Colocasia esculenta TaxID=4460 RepID=A0A843VZG4_COLES|nr:hypothetical protein [Colocasia esculenta]